MSRDSARAAPRSSASLPYHHQAVKHGVREYVKGQAHTNGIESFWSMLKRGYDGTYHQMSPKHLGRYVGEFAGRHNDPPRRHDRPDGQDGAQHGGQAAPIL